MTDVGGVPEIVGGRLAVVTGAVTRIENAGSSAVDSPLFALMMMFE